MTFEELQKANETIKTTPIKGKDYAEVNQRIKAFRMLFPEGYIETKLISDEGGKCVFKAEVGFWVLTSSDSSPFKCILGTGTAYENEGSSFINSTSYIENCETSAVGRALAMLGIGIDISVASAEEVGNAIKQQETPPQFFCADCGKKITDTTRRNGEIMTAGEVVAFSRKTFRKCLCADCMRKAEKEAKKKAGLEALSNAD